MIQRRTQDRLSIAQSIMLCWQDRSSSRKQFGTVKDLSLDGVGVLVKEPLPVGMQVTFSFAEGELTGLVKHHSEVMDGHLLGIEFVGPVRSRATPQTGNAALEPLSPSPLRP